MTRKQLDARLNEWLIQYIFKPLFFFAPYFRTNYRLQSDVLTFKRPFRKPVSIRIDEFDEIGVETTDQGPFIEDVFLILKRGQLRIRIGNPHPVFEMLMNRFSSLEGFDWKSFGDAQSCTENRYFLCWKRFQVSDNQNAENR